MKAIIEKEYVVNKVIGDIKCGVRFSFFCKSFK